MKKYKAIIAGDEVEIRATPLAAIRARCVDCMAGSVYEVKRCVVPDCPLYPFRMGKNPFNTKRILTDEQKKAVVNRLQNARERVRLQTQKGNSNENEK